MADQTLLSFVRDHLTRGVSGDEIREILLAAGWPEADVDGALEEVWATQQNLFRRAQETSQERALGDAAANRDRRRAMMRKLAAWSVAMLVLFGGIGWATWVFASDVMISVFGARISSVKAFEYRVEAVVDGLTANPIAAILPKGASFPKQSNPEIGSDGLTKFSFDGAFDGLSEQPKMRTSFALVSGSGETETSFGGDFRSVDRSYYVKLKQLSVPGGPDLSALTMKWISFDPKVFKENGITSLGSSKSSAAGQGGEKGSDDTVSPTPAFGKGVRMLLREGAVLRSGTTWFDRSIDDGMTIAISFSLDRENALRAMTKLHSPEYGFEGRQLEPLREWVSSAETITGTLRVGWKTLLPRRLEIVKVGSRENEAASDRTTITADFPAYGGAVSIEAPSDEDVIPITEALPMILMQISGKQFPKDIPSFPGGVPGR